MFVTAVRASRRTYAAAVSVLRLVVAAWVVVLLARAAAGAWRQRQLALTVWRRIRLRHVAGSLALFVLVAGVVIALLAYVPPLRFGLGALIDFSGNAVFVPLEETAARPGAPGVAGGPDWLLIGVATGFLGVLALMLPWLAFVEEEVFRAGLEDAGVGRQVLTALVFGLAHLVMLVPVGAALAIGLAGYVYGVVYRRAYRAADPDDIPEVVQRSFRPTKRSARAADRARQSSGAPGSSGDLASLLLADRSPERRQAAAVLASTVLHTTFNTLVVTLVWVSVVASAL